MVTEPENHPVYRLHDEIQETLPNTRAYLDAPSHPEGRWFLDLCLGKNNVVVEWQKTTQTFGVSLVDPEVGYGEKPDWVTSNYYKAYARVLHHLAFGPVR